MALDLTDWTIVYDLDGTLVDSAPDLHAALNHTLDALNQAPVGLDDIRHMIGDGAKALIRKGLEQNNQPVDEAQIDAELWPRFIDFYKSNAATLSRPFADVESCLSAFETAGALQMVCTNKAESLAEIVLDELKLAPYFHTMTGGDTFPYRKPDGRHILTMLSADNRNPERAIMIGDSLTDARAARNAELPFVFVTFGYGTTPTGEDATPYVINAWSEMPAIIEHVTKASA